MSVPSSPRGQPAGQTAVEHVIARVQRLCETPRPDGGYPLASSVEGYFLGGITAIVAAVIRAERLTSQ